MKRSFALLAPLALIGILLIVYFDRLPERVASHFDANGKADGWTDRGSFTTLAALFPLGIVGFFAALMAALPRMPASMINMPAREYWLAPERRDSTMQTLSKHLALHGVLVLLFFAYLLYTILEANAGQAIGSGIAVWPALIAYLALTMLALVWLLVDFRVPDTDA